MAPKLETKSIYSIPHRNTATVYIVERTVVRFDVDYHRQEPNTFPSFLQSFLSMLTNTGSRSWLMLVITISIEFNKEKKNG